MSTPQERSNIPGDFRLVEYRVGALEEAIKQISAAVKTIAENTSQIASLELRHTETREALERAFGAVGESNRRHEALANRVIELELNRATYADVEKLEVRVNTIEIVMPSLKKSSHWIDAGVLALVGLLVLTALKAALHF